MPITRTAIATSTRMNTHHSSMSVQPEERAAGSAGASSAAVVVAPGPAERERRDPAWGSRLFLRLGAYE